MNILKNIGRILIGAAAALIFVIIADASFDAITTLVGGML